MLVAALAGLSVASAYARWRGRRVRTIIDAALVCAVAGALAGRAFYVWTNWDYFVENTDAVADLSQGGMSWQGAFIVGLFALLLFALVTRKSFWQLADAAALGLALAASIGWYGAHVTHLYYGIAIDETLPSSNAFEPLAQSARAFAFNFVQDLPDAYNVIALRIPVQWMASIFFMGLFFVLLVIALRESSRAHDGSVFLAYLAAASAAGFVFGFWRGDTTLLWNGLRVDQWLNAAWLVLALALAGGRKWFALQRPRGPQTRGKVIQTA
jgi:phosphatidylglycerol:prolipoprotein diacylglycerol transferase